MQKTIQEYKTILKLWGTGKYTKADIARQTGIARTTVNRCIKKYSTVKNFTSTINQNGKITLPRQQKNMHLLNRLQHPMQDDERLCSRYAYLLGIVLGDGSLTEHTKVRTVQCLRVSCDIKYPNIMEAIKEAMSTIMPLNSINTQSFSNELGKPSWTDVYCYSQDWKLFFPFFKPGKGKKSSYKIELSNWQKEIVVNYTKDFLKGLIQTDGHRSISPDKYKYVRYGFTQKSTDIKNIFLWACELLSLSPTMYRRTHSDPEYGIRKLWHISLCKGRDTEFLDTFIGSKT